MAPRILLIAACALSLLVCANASAQSEHTVRAGQSLARIARRHHVSVASLAAANGLARDAQVRPGQVLRIPEQGTHYVAQGETLASIARDHECSVADLQRLNRLRDRPLQVGQRLVLPGFVESRERDQAAQRWGRARNPGVATLYRHSLERRFRVRLVDRRGRARRTAIRRLRELMRPSAPRSRLGPAPPARLVEMLARISDHFGGRTITIVSGYRSAGGYTRESSQHTRGHALDVRIQGVPAQALRDYVRATFDRVGVGFYPRTGFVHLDVRDRSAYWVDWSRRGEAPRYQRRGQRAPEDASADEIERAGMGGGEEPAEAGEAGAIEEDDPTVDPDRAALEDESGDGAD